MVTQHAFTTSNPPISLCVTSCFYGNCSVL